MTRGHHLRKRKKSPGLILNPAVHFNAPRDTQIALRFFICEHRRQIRFPETISKDPFSRLSMATWDVTPNATVFR